MDCSERKNLEMETEEHYRKKAKSYRISTQYGKMISLYPTLESTIKDCHGENLID